MNSLVGQSGPSLTESQGRSTIAARPGAVTPGFRQFVVPTAGSYPARIALDGQGRMWITERDANKIARFDPADGGLGQSGISLRRTASPGGLVVDGAGEIWFTEMAGNQIGRFDPDPVPEASPNTPSLHPTASPGAWTQASTVRSGLPNSRQQGRQASTQFGPDHRVPHTSAGVRAGGHRCWQSLRLVYLPAVDRVARLEIATGIILDFFPPTPGSSPQDVGLSSQENPWFTERGGNKLLLIDLQSHGLYWEYRDPYIQQRTLCHRSGRECSCLVYPVGGQPAGSLFRSVPPYRIRVAHPGQPAHRHSSGWRRLCLVYGTGCQSDWASVFALSL